MMMAEILQSLGELEVQIKLIEARKTSLLKQALEIIANGQNAETSQDGKTETATESAQEN